MAKVYGTQGSLAGGAFADRPTIAQCVADAASDRSARRKEQICPILEDYKRRHGNRRAYLELRN